MRVLGVDPGDVHVGVASLTDGEFEWAMEVTQDKFVEILMYNDPPDYVALESFSLDPGRARFQSGSKMATAALIGATKAMAEFRGFKVIMQQPSIRGVCLKSPYWKRIGEALSYESDHAKDALCHAVYCYYFDLTNDRYQKSK